MINFPFKLFYGVVEDVNDPEKTGRVRVRCYGFHSENKSNIATEHLPWATVAMPVTSSSSSGLGSSHGLLAGASVIGFFRDGDECQDPVVMFTYNGKPVDEVNVNLGFNDPTGKLPRYVNESDVNRLIRNENIDETIVKSKEDSLEKKVTSAFGVEWSEPKSAYAAVYPNNKVIETESGHIVEFDDTDGSERINLHHRSGTFVEIHPDGSTVSKYQGNNYEIVAKDNNVLIKGDCNITVNGNANIKCVEANVECKNVHVDATDEFLVETKLFKVVASTKALFETPLVEGTSEVKDATRTMSGDRSIYNAHQHSVSGHSIANPTGSKQ